MFHMEHFGGFLQQQHCKLRPLCYNREESTKGGASLGTVVAIVNQKGGVGKSTTAVNLSAALGKLGRSVLIADLDPQGNSTSGYGVNKKGLTRTAYRVLMGECRASEAILPTRFANADILPADSALYGAEVEMVELENRTMMLRKSLTEVRDRYDFIFFDCPPSLGLITLNALTAADSILVPLQCEFYSLEGLTQLMDTVRLVKQRYNPDLDIFGLLFTMFDGRLNLTSQVVREVKRHFSDRVFRTQVPRNVRISEAPSFGEPVVYYDRTSKGAEAYMKLAEEILKRR